MMRPIAAVALAIFVSVPASAADLNEEEYRLYCGYLEAVKNPATAKLKGKAQTDKIAKIAKVKPQVLADAVDRGAAAGSSCESIAEQTKASVKAGLDAVLPGRISFYDLDASDVAWLAASR